MSNEQLNPAPMSDFFEALFEKALDRALKKRNAVFPTVDEETSRMIAKINAKPRITIAEAALLLGCSTSHLYAKITAAKKSKSKHPVPFLDLDGVYVLPREELLAWAKMEKERGAQKRKRKQE
jgi:hypothetical protein